MIPSSLSSSVSFSKVSGKSSFSDVTLKSSSSVSFSKLSLKSPSSMSISVLLRFSSSCTGSMMID